MTIYNIVSIVAFSLSGICFLLAVVFWLRFDVWEIIGDLTGRTAKKTIEQMRAENEKNGKKSYRPTPLAMERGAKTEMMVHKIGEAADDKGPEREVPTDKLSNGTEYLTPETEVLGDGTEVLSAETELLGEGTEVLSDTAKLSAKVDKNAFVVVQNIVLTHTNEDMHI